MWKKVNKMASCTNIFRTHKFTYNEKSIHDDLFSYSLFRFAKTSNDQSKWTTDLSGVCLKNLIHKRLRFNSAY